MTATRFPAPSAEAFHTGRRVPGDTGRRPGVRVAGFFPGLGSRASYQNLDPFLLESAVPRITAIYRDAAAALGCAPERLLMAPGDLPRDGLERQGFIGAAVLVHNLAVEAYLRHRVAEHGSRLEFAAYAGESFGVLAAAVAAGSLSVFDGVKIAQAFTPLVLAVATAPGTDEGFARALARYLPESARRTPLVPEPCHVIGLKAADPESLAEILDAIGARYRLEAVELHKTYSPTQANVYVSTSAKAEFDRFAAGFAGVAVEELKEPTVFLAHSARMEPARRALARFMTLNGIAFARPRIPVVSNHDRSLLTTAREVRQGILAMTDRVMASRDTCESLDGLDADFLLELGPGGKSLELLRDNHVAAPSTAYTGSGTDTERLLRVLGVLARLAARLEGSREAGFSLDDAHYDVLRDLFRLAAVDEFCDELSSRVLERTVTADVLHAEHPESPAFRQLLEVFQHTRNHREHIDVANGELIAKARLKKRLTAEDPARLGTGFVELRVLGRDGLAETRTLDVGRPEVLVFHFDGRVAPGRPAHPLPRQYELFESLVRHRPALLAQNDHYLAGGDATGWLAALAVSGALPLADALELHAADPRTADADRILDGLAAAAIPLLSPDGVPVWSKDDLHGLTRAVLRDRGIGGGPRRIRLNGGCQVVSLGAPLHAADVDAGPHEVDVVRVATPAEARRKRLNPALDDVESGCLLALTDENGRVLHSARSRRLLSSAVYSYIEIDESVVGFGKGGSESMTIFLRRQDEEHVTVRKILSEALTTAHWNPDGVGVMLPPFAKAAKQADFLRALPAPVRRYFPEVHRVLERSLPVPPHLRQDGRDADHEVIYEMSYVAGEEVSRFIEKHSPPPAVVARLYHEIIRVLKENVHSVGRVPAPGETLEVSYFQKIEDRLALCRRTAPETFDDRLLATEQIVLNGVAYLNASALLRRFRAAPEFLRVLEPNFHSLVMGDTNTENIKVTDVEPLLRAKRLIEAGAPKAQIEAALAAITAAALGIRFLDPRAIGFKSDGRETRDDPMYDNKPWHNSIGHYDEIHFEQFTLSVEVGEGRTPAVEIAFLSGNPYQKAYRVRDVVAGGGVVDTAAPQGMEDYFATVMPAALGLGEPDSPFLRDDPFWLIRFVFMMGQHFTAMPPFHFQKELDGTVVDTYQTQRRPVAIYCEGIKWLNWALQMLEGTRTEFLGLAVPRLPHLPG